MSFLRTAAAAGALAALASPNFAQITEIEPNDNKASATPAPGMTSGMYLVGNSVTTGGTGLDYWCVSTAPAAAGIYRHELVITTSGAPGHFGALVGLNQSGGVPGICPNNGTAPAVGTLESIVQYSSTASLPARMNAWYGFGKGEQVYYEIYGQGITTADYHVTFASTAVAPLVCPVTFAAGPITLQTVGLSPANSTDTDIYLYDSNFDIVISAEGAASNDDEHCHPGSTIQSWLARTLAPGTYYLGVGRSNTCSNLPSPSDDDFMSGPVMDFPDSLVCSATGTASNRNFRITDGVNVYNSTGVATTSYYEVVWVQFTVGGGTTVAICNPGFGGVVPCPCSNPPSGAGRGCNNSNATGGASIGASGSASLANDTLVLSTAGQVNSTTLVWQGDADISASGGVVSGMGVRCVGGNLKRLYGAGGGLMGSGGGVSVPAPGDLTPSAKSASLGDPLLPGMIRYYFAAYRDPAVLGGCPATSTFNYSNAVGVTWN